MSKQNQVSQTAKKNYLLNGAVYIFSKKFLKYQNSKKNYAYIMPKSRSVDIDDIDDLRLAEFHFKKLKGKISETTQKKLIIFNRNAYILRDLYCHALEEYSKIYDIYFITSDLFVSREIIKTFRSYVFKKNLSDFIIIRNNVSSVLFNKNLNNFLRNLKNSEYYVLTSIPENILDFIFKKVQRNKDIIITWFDNFKIDINHLNYQNFKVQENKSNISNFLSFLIIIFFNKNYYNYQNLILTKLLFPEKKIFFICFNNITKKLYNNFCPF